MENVWVYKDDGTLQCGLGKEVPLAEMQEELEAIIGTQNVLSAEKRHLPVFLPSLCGFRTGSVNAYEITPDGSWLLFQGYVGKQGFELWIWGQPTVATTSTRAVARAARFGGNQPSPAGDPTIGPFPLKDIEEGFLVSGPETPFPLSKPKDATGMNAILRRVADRQLKMSAVATEPVLIRELIGHKCRFLGPDGAVTLDLQPERVNIRVDRDRKITDIWFG